MHEAWLDHGKNCSVITSVGIGGNLKINGNQCLQFKQTQLHSDGLGDCLCNLIKVDQTALGNKGMAIEISKHFV